MSCVFLLLCCCTLGKYMYPIRLLSFPDLHWTSVGSKRIGRFAIEDVTIGKIPTRMFWFNWPEMKKIKTMSLYF